MIVVLANDPSPKRARVIRATDPHILHLFTPETTRVRKLVHAAILQYTDTQDEATAWKKIVLPTDRIGIKIHTYPGPVMSTHHTIVETIIDGLQQAGIPRNHILVFDRYGPQMEAAGYPPDLRDDGVIFTATVPYKGYDPHSGLDLPIVGKLIWGDFEFKKKTSTKEEDDQLSTKSYFSRILTEDVDKMINIAVPITDPVLGFYGAQVSSSLSLVDNYRRFQRPSFAREDSLTEIFSNAIIQKKCVLHILDGLVAQFAGGPTFDPQYCWPLQTIYMSQDAVALDTLAIEQINQQRPKVQLLPLKDEVAYLKAAAKAGLGIADLSQIDIIDAEVNR